MHLPCLVILLLALASDEVLVLDERSLPEIAGWSEESVKALAESVRGGRGLVVAGRAAAALPESSEFSRLLGRKGLRGEPPEAWRGGFLLVEVLDQSHPIAQCVTHLFIPDCSPRVEAAPEVVPIAVGCEDSTFPALWTRNEGQGRIVVIALDPCSRNGEKSPPLSFLVPRAVEWASGRDVKARLPEALPIAAALSGDGVLARLRQRPGFYRGRQIAPFMTFHGAGWLERADRVETELPEKVLDALEIAEGSTVADLGAGTGYFTRRLAKRVGPSGKVLAVEIQKEMLDLLRKNLEKEGVTNVESVLATPEDPRLPPDSVDVVLMVDVYHELSAPDMVLATVKKALRPGRAGGEGRRPGRLVLVEYRGEDPAVPIKPLHRMTQAQARAEIEPLGLRWVETKEFLPHQHVLIFEK